MTPARRLLAAILVGFGVAALVNVAWEVSLPEGAGAVISRDDGRLSTLTRTEYVGTSDRNAISVALLEAAGGGVLVVPDVGLVDPYRVTNVSRVVLRVEEYDPRLSAGEAAAVRGFAHIEGVASLAPGAERQPFVVAWLDDDGDPPTMRLWFWDDQVYLVDDRVMTVVRS